jgi:hypothetical protein
MYIAPLNVNLGWWRAPRERYTLNLQAVPPNAMLSIEKRRRGRRRGANPALNLGFRPETTTRIRWERGDAHTRRLQGGEQHPRAP